MPKLVHSLDGSLVDELELQEGTWLIGRRPECDIWLDDVTVSGKHALLTVKPSAYMDGLLDIYIEDQGSTNGTTVNGKPVQRHLMKHEDAVLIGGHQFTLIDENTRSFETTAIILPEDE